MTARPYFRFSVSELEALVRTSEQDTVVLEGILSELAHRESVRGKQLQSHVRRLLEGAPIAPNLFQQAHDDPGLPAGAADGEDTNGGPTIAEPTTPPDSSLPTVRDTVSDDPDEDVAPVPPTRIAGRDIPFASPPAADDGVPLELARLRQVFRFLRDFAERNAPVCLTLSQQLWKLAFEDLPSHPSIWRRPLAVSAGSTSGDAAEAGPDALADDALLRVRRPTLSAPPKVPSSYAAWVRVGSDDPATPPTLFDVLSRPRRRDELTGDETIDTHPVQERRLDDPTRETALQGWLASWAAWARSELPARQAMEVFKALYALLGQIEREGERVELMLGDGRLRRMTPTGMVDHPILLQRVELMFDPAIPEFRIEDADRAPELYGTALQGEDGLSGERLYALQQELETAGYHPLAAESAGFLRRVAGLLGPSARYLDESSAAPAPTVPTLRRAPTLFLRRRGSGLPAAIARILEDLQHTDALPPALVNIVGGRANRAVSSLGDDASPSAAGVDHAASEILTAVGEPPDVLFAKLANLEQVQVARTLERHGAVLVQGPPGTGKSHTIANLIGHLVAQGKRVLVTSHTTKALRVLRQQIPEDLRPLCVALLDHDLEGRAQLEEAVRSIVERIGSAEESSMRREVARLTEARTALIATTATLSRQLQSARTAEYEPIVLAGESVSPVDAARTVKHEGDRHAWLPGPLTPGAPLPLAPDELKRLYATNQQLSGDDERELAASLPPRDLVLGGPQVRELVRLLSSDDVDATQRWWSHPAREEDAAALTALQQCIEHLVHDFDTMPGWQRTLVEQSRQGETERTIWRKLRAQVLEAAAAADASRELLLEFAPECTASPGEEDTSVIADLTTHLSNGGGLGRLTLLMKPQWKAVLAKWRVNGQAPKRPQELAAIAARLERDRRRRELAQRWERQAVPIGLPPFASLPEPVEQTLAAFTEPFDSVLTWWETRWYDLTARLGQTGFKWGLFRDAELGQRPPASPFALDLAIVSGPLRDAVRARLAATSQQRAVRTVEEQLHLLRQYHGETSAALQTALTAGDIDAWDRARQDLENLSTKADAWTTRVQLLERLGRDAPEWANAISRRQPPHDTLNVPGDVAQAWRHRQLVEELERREAVDEQRIAQELERRRGELRTTTKALIDRKTWLAQLLRTTGAARQALVGWADLQKKIGKGTGKRVPALQAEARKLLSAARDAVPVWIMPLTRVAESFDPRGRKFDVVIVDEASQSDVTGLVAVYMGKQTVIVGDHEQVSPSAVGQRIEDTQQLIAQHLIGIPNSILYDGQTSIYDLARQSFEGGIALREHFRCVPDIIEFCNQLSYNGQMRPLRDPSTAQAPHLAEFVVPSIWLSTTAPKINDAEARIGAALLAAMAETPAYFGKSFGAISLVGDEQAMLLQQYLLSLLGAEVLHFRRFTAGNSAQFQGDERDIMLLTMVDQPSMTGRPLALRDTQSFKQRFNVAVSRAKDQLWLVHSLDPSRDLQPNDLRRRLIDHVRNPGAVRRAVLAATTRAESPFEKAVIERLMSAGFRVEPQVEVGRYRIDMVIYDDRNRVALECDGDRFHPPEQIPEDLARQAVLERAGWRFIRLRGTRFFRDPDGSMRWVVDELSRLGIQPIGASTSPSPPADSAELREAVVRRAWKIMERQGWIPEPVGGSP